MAAPRALLRVLTLVISVAVLAGAAAAQQPADAGLEETPTDSTTTEASLPEQRVVLDDGTVLVGVIVEEAETTLSLLSDDGIVRVIPRERIREVGPLLEGRLRRFDPTRTRLFFSPTARTLPRGTGRFSLYYIFPSVAYGVTDRVDVSYGSLVPIVLNAANLKLQVLRRERVQVAIGANALFSLGDLFEGADIGFGGIVGTFYGLATLGTETRAVTLGLYGAYGSGFDDDLFIAEGALALVGLEWQLSDSAKLLSENYLPLGTEGGEVVSLTGIRLGSERFSVDVAFLLGAAVSDGALGRGPYFGIAYNFGN
ncbi:MAG: hypothetical protein AAGG50_18865 [Bacteroidota bacterium]